MVWSNEYFAVEPEKLCLVKCPYCLHKFRVQGGTIHRSFTCIKCGTEWYAERKEGLPSQDSVM